AEAGQRRNDDIERVLGIAAVRSGIRQRPDDLAHVPEGPRPAVSGDERYRLRALAALVDEMDVDVVDARAEVVIVRHLALLGTPVERGPPVLDELGEIVAVRAVAPIVVGE